MNKRLELSQRLHDTFALLNSIKKEDSNFDINDEVEDGLLKAISETVAPFDLRRLSFKDFDVDEKRSDYNKVKFVNKDLSKAMIIKIADRFFSGLYFDREMKTILSVSFYDFNKSASSNYLYDLSLYVDNDITEGNIQDISQFIMRSNLVFFGIVPEVPQDSGNDSSSEY